MRAGVSSDHTAMHQLDTPSAPTLALVGMRGDYRSWSSQRGREAVDSNLTHIRAKCVYVYSGAPAYTHAPGRGGERPHGAVGGRHSPSPTPRKALGFTHCRRPCPPALLLRGDPPHRARFRTERSRRLSIDFGVPLLTNLQVAALFAMHSTCTRCGSTAPTAPAPPEASGSNHGAGRASGQGGASSSGDVATAELSEGVRVAPDHSCPAMVGGNVPSALPGGLSGCGAEAFRLGCGQDGLVEFAAPPAGKVPLPAPASEPCVLTLQRASSLACSSSACPALRTRRARRSHHDMLTHRPTRLAPLLRPLPC